VNLRSEIRQHLVDNSSNILDPLLTARGFKRDASSLLYRRVHNGAMQIIDNSFEIHPRDQPNAAAAVCPTMEVFVPPVDALLKDIVDGDLGLLAGITRGTSWQSIHHTSAKKEAGRWLLYQPESVPPAIEAMKEFIQRWTLPLLDYYTSAEAIVAVDQEIGERRVARDRAQMMRVVAAALACRRKDYAQAVLDKWLGAPVPRRRYRRVFDYVDRAS
jgi:hypothetical protein